MADSDSLAASVQECYGLRVRADWLRQRVFKMPAFHHLGVNLALFGALDEPMFVEQFSQVRR